MLRCDALNARQVTRNKLLSYFLAYFLVRRKISLSHILSGQYIKEVVHAMDVNHDGMIDQTELSALIQYIDAQDDVTQQDLEDVVRELGDEKQQIPILDVETLIMGTVPRV
jgi:Ca2+-binding EF-hand superfamily protein